MKRHLLLFVFAAVLLPWLASAADLSTLTPPELEKLYLGGKINAKQYEKLVKDYTASHPKPSLPVFPGRSGPSSPVLPPSQPPVAITPNNIAPPPVVPPDTKEQSRAKLTDLEARAEELIKLKEAREKAALTNAVATPTPVTRRQKLDEALKLFIDGKLTDEQYRQKREKIMSEPE